MQQIYDLIIIGAGAAGMTAAIIGASEGQNVVILDKNAEIGGRLKETEEIHDYPGFPELSGTDLISILKEHLDFHQVEIFRAEVTKIDAADVIKSVWSKKGEFAATAIVIATGEEENDWIRETLGCNRFGQIAAGEDCRTSLSCVYAAGNARQRPYSAILNDMADGANSIKSFLEDIM